MPLYRPCKLAILSILAMDVSTELSAAQQSDIVVSSSRLQVHIPKSLHRKEGYDHIQTKFGIPPQGGSISQMAYYAASDLCDPNVNTRGGFPTRLREEDGSMQPWQSPYILIVDRGSCSFVTQVRNAQRSGAAGVIIADKTCLCSMGDSCKSEPDVPCQGQLPSVADDGSGSDITIPSFFMFKQDADLIKNELRNDLTVEIEMAWSLPSPDAKVKYSLWTLPTDMISQNFQFTFKKAALALGEGAYFTPHMYVHDGVQAKCRGRDGVNLWCLNLCANNGRYCATDPDYDVDDGVSGLDVVAESLRRICIWRHYGEKDGIGVEWWDYVREFNNQCNTPEQFADINCIKNIMTGTGIGSDVIEQCMEDSGGLKNDHPNVLLEEQIAKSKEMGIVVIPAAYVNNRDIRGSAVTSTAIFNAICEGYPVEAEPQICKVCASCSDRKMCIHDGHCQNSVSNRIAVSAGMFVGGLVGLAAFFGIVLFVRDRRSRNYMREHVRDIVAEYIPLEDDNDTMLDRNIA